MTNSASPPPGYYLAADGQWYPVPAGFYVASDGEMYRLPPPSPGGWTGSQWTPAGTVLIGGAIGALIGSALPWATVGPFSVAGTEGDGMITLFLGIGCLACGIPAVFRRSRRLAVTALVGAAAIVLISFHYIIEFSSADEGALGETSVGGGLLLTMIGGGAALVGALLEAVRAHKEQSSGQSGGRHF